MSYQYPFKDAKEQLKLSVWSEGIIDPKLDKDVWCRDKYGTLIKYSEHGNTNSKYGWEIDHKIPTAKGGKTAKSNLQPLYWKTNREKGDIYPWKRIKYVIHKKIK